MGAENKWVREVIFKQALQNWHLKHILNMYAEPSNYGLISKAKSKRKCSDCRVYICDYKTQQKLEMKS